MKPRNYIEGSQHQLKEWVEGRPWHNPFTPDGDYHESPKEGGECCPDFSCCVPDLLWAKKRRLAFFHASPEVQEHMLMGALGSLMGAPVEAFAPGVYVMRVDQHVPISDEVTDLFLKEPRS